MAVLPRQHNKYKRMIPARKVSFSTSAIENAKSSKLAARIARARDLVSNPEYRCQNQLSLESVYFGKMGLTYVVYYLSK